MQTLEEILRSSLLRMELGVPVDFTHYVSPTLERDIMFADISDDMTVYLDFNIFDLSDTNKAQIQTSSDGCIKFWLYGDLKMSEMVKVGDIWFHGLDVFSNGDIHARFYQLSEDRTVVDLDPIVVFPYGGGFTATNFPTNINHHKLVQFVDYFITTARIKFSRVLT